MRINIIMDVDGTDEQQLDVLEDLELAAEEQTFGSIGGDTNYPRDCVIISVTEIPERQVRGPAKPAPRPRIRVLAWYKHSSLDPREVVAVSPDGTELFFEFSPGTSFGPFPVENYTFTLMPGLMP